MGAYEAARTAFRKIRLSDTNGEPVCPKCGCCESDVLEVDMPI